MSLISDLFFQRTTSLNQEELNRRMRLIADAIETLREFAPDWQAEVDALRSVGLERINTALLPAYQQIIDLANLGALLSTSSDTSVEIGLGAKTFIVPASKRQNFAPTPFLMAAADGDYDRSMIGLLSSYDITSGELVILVERISGEGTFSRWMIGPVATTDDLENLRGFVQQAALQVGDDRIVVREDRDSTETLSRAFNEKYLGPQPADPIVDGNGDPVGTGALYTNTGSGKLRFYNGVAWQDATAASSITVHKFTADGRVVAYPLPEAPSSKASCFVIVGGAPQMKEAFETAGATISFPGDWPKNGTVVEVTIIGQLAIGTPSDETVDAAKIKAGAAGAIRNKLGTSVLAGFRNKIINGDFRIWQRGTALAAGTGFPYLADRWMNRSNGSTMAPSRQTLPFGTIPGINDRYFHRCVVASVAGNANYAALRQIIEGVDVLAGTISTLTFYAKADAPKKVGIELVQSFGSGGSLENNSIGAQSIDITTQWKKFSLPISIPLITGKVVGTSLDSLFVIFYFDAGADISVRASNIGRQSGTFDIAHVSLVEGDATAEDDPFSPRHTQQEWALCQRYYWQLDTSFFVAATASVEGPAFAVQWDLPVQMRAKPTGINNILDGNYVSAEPVGAQWTVGPYGYGWSAKSGTAFPGVHTSKDHVVMTINGATYSGLPNALMLGPGIIVAADAEL